MNIYIIGSGISGLTSAIILAQAGYSVSIIENNDKPGGVAGQYSEQGYTFDTGPTWYLMPEVFERFFNICDRNIHDYIELVDLEPSYRIFYNRDEYIDIQRDLLQNAAAFESYEKGSGDKLKEYLCQAKYKYDIALNEFLYKDYNSLLDLLNRRMIFDGMKLQVFNKLDNYVKKFFKNHKLRKIVEFNTVFLGCSPYKTPALYSLMSHVDITQGVTYPKGGIFSFVSALYSLAEEVGVRFRFNETVTSLDVHDSHITSIITNKSSYKPDVVLSSIDYQHTEEKLLEPKYQTYTSSYWEKRVLAPTAFLIYLGLNKKLTQLQHHSLFLSEQWDEHFKDVFDTPEWPDNPSIYIGCPSRNDPSVAPEGCENIFILVPVAPGLEDTDAVRNTFLDKIITILEYIAEESIADAIVVKKIKAHRDFITQHKMYKGSSMGLAHTLFQTAYFRPKRKSKKVDNLYYTGQYTHPGIGMPMVVISGELAAQRIIKDYKK